MILYAILDLFSGRYYRCVDYDGSRFQAVLVLFTKVGQGRSPLLENTRWGGGVVMKKGKRRKGETFKGKGNQ
jgi:hypothetical protein